MLNNDFSNIVSDVSRILDIKINEAKILTTLYRLGPQTAGVLSKRLNINRTTLYGILDGLLILKLIKKHPNKEGVLFESVSYEKILDLFDEKRQISLKKKKEFKKLVVDFYETGFEKNILVSGRPTMTLYEGINAVQDQLLNLLEMIPKGESLLGYVNVSSRQIDEFRTFWPIYYKKRIQRKIFMKQVSPNNDDCFKHSIKDDKEYRETRLISPDLFPFQKDYEINILPDKFVTLYLNPVNPYMLIYDDKALIEAQKVIFNNYWQSMSKVKLHFVDKVKLAKKNLVKNLDFSVMDKAVTVFSGFFSR